MSASSTELQISDPAITDESQTERIEELKGLKERLATKVRDIWDEAVKNDPDEADPDYSILQIKIDPVTGEEGVSGITDVWVQPIPSRHRKEFIPNAPDEVLTGATAPFPARVSTIGDNVFSTILTEDGTTMEGVVKYKANGNPSNVDLEVLMTALERKGDSTIEHMR